MNLSRQLLVSLTAALGLVAFASPVAAQQKVILKASDVHPLGYPTVEAIERMGKKLEKDTNGRISILPSSCRTTRRRQTGLPR